MLIHPNLEKTNLTDSLDFKQSVHVIDVLVDEAIRVAYKYLILFLTRHINTVMTLFEEE